VLEIWQADANGHYAAIGGEPNPKAEKGWRGFARVPTSPDGEFTFFTTPPGRVLDGHGSTQAPHALVMLGMRGLLKFLMTRMYFPGPETDHDAVLASVPKERRKTLIAQPGADGSLIWNVVVQGGEETVFFDY
jgi:protocatechuate 3,4-dioxygenase alpha subunit